MTQTLTLEAVERWLNNIDRFEGQLHAHGKVDAINVSELIKMIKALTPLARTQLEAREGDVRWRAVPSLVRDWKAFQDGKSALQIGIPEWLHLQVEETLTALTALQSELWAAQEDAKISREFLEIDKKHIVAKDAELSAIKADNERLREAIRAYENSPEPVADCWDTESGEPEPGASAFPSDWSHHAADYEKARRRDAMRAAIGLPVLLTHDDFRRNIDWPEPARAALGEGEAK